MYNRGIFQHLGKQEARSSPREAVRLSLAALAS